MVEIFFFFFLIINVDGSTPISGEWSPFLTNENPSITAHIHGDPFEFLSLSFLGIVKFSHTLNQIFNVVLFSGFLLMLLTRQYSYNSFYQRHNWKNLYILLIFNKLRCFNEKKMVD